jgi:chemotaxis protein MotB
LGSSRGTGSIGISRRIGAAADFVKENIMRAVRYLMGMACGLAVLALATGCESPADARQIEFLQGRVAELERAEDDYRAQLAAWQDRGRQSDQALRDLEAKLAAARAELANRPVEVATERQDGWTIGEGIAWTTLQSDILFDSGEITLKPEGRASLREAVRVIQTEFPDRDIWVVGHTDTDPLKRVAGKYVDNMDLSQNRGRVVAQELVNLGIAKERIVAAGQGENNPVEPNTPATKAKNRRVEIIAVKRPAADVATAARGG